MATTSIPAPEAQATISPVGRIFGVFFSPKPTFEDIVRKPSWVLPIIVQTLFSIAIVFAMSQRINWKDFVSQQIEKSPQAAQLSAEQKEQRAEAGAKFAGPFTYAVVILVPTCAALVIGLVMWGAYNLLAGANVTFATSFAITAHALLTGVVTSILFILILFVKPPGTVDLENPIATNVAAFLPEDSAKWLVTLCKSIDIFSFWMLILIAIGFAAASPKKLKGGKAFSIAFSVWAAYVVVRTGIAFITS